MMKVIQIQMMKKLKVIMKLKVKVKVHYNNTKILVSKKIVKQILYQKMKIVKVKVNPKNLYPKIYQITKLIQIQTKQMPMKIQL